MKKAQRPQDPQPPYPYRSVDVEYSNGEVKLAGTLTIPEGEGPFPAVILLSGSGAQNRDSEVFGHRPFAVWADVLSRVGIAVLRSDDRGVGDSGGNPAISTTSDFADDAAVAVRYLASRDEINAKKIGLMGHSEGGVIAPLAAQREKSVAFVVLLAAPAVPGEELLPVQSGRLVRLLGANDEEVAAVEAAYNDVTALLKKEERGEALTEAIHKLKIAQGDLSAPTPQEIEMFISPWMTYFLFHDPRPALAELTIPVLAINGDLDLQVDADQNLNSIKRHVKRSKLLTVQRFEKLNHLLQNAETGAIEEYGTIEETIAPEVLETVRRWILDL